VEQNAGRIVEQEHTGKLWIIVVNPVWLPVLIALGLELMTVIVALMDFT
jgi:hypothetical protein